MAIKKTSKEDKIELSLIFYDIVTMVESYIDRIIQHHYDHNPNKVIRVEIDIDLSLNSIFDELANRYEKAGWNIDYDGGRNFTLY